MREKGEKEPKEGWNALHAMNLQGILVWIWWNDTEKFQFFLSNSLISVAKWNN